MADVSNVEYNFKMNVRATEGALAGTASIGSSATVQSADANQPVTKNWSEADRTMAGTSETLDLTALPNGEDWTGLKVQFIHIKAKSNNTAGILFKVGGSNPYNILGHADGEVTLYAGDELLLKFKDHLPDISGTAKAISVSSGSSGQAYSINLVAG